MSEQLYAMKIQATGEVRDADGNLISSTPVEFKYEVPESHLRALGATDEDLAAIKEQNP